MAILMNLETYKVYPRVYYFQRRVDDLYERFKRVIGQFNEDYQDKMWLSDIQSWIEKMKPPPGFKIECRLGLNFGEKDVIVKQVTDAPTIKSLPVKGNLQIYVFYDKLEDFTVETKQKTVQNIVSFVGKTTRECQEHLNTCFAMVDVPSQESAEDIQLFRNSIIEALGEQFSEYEWGDRVVIGPDQVSLSTKISAVLETLVMSVFHKMYDYLDRFLQQHPNFVSHDFKMTEVKGLKETVSDFVNNLLPLMEVRKQMSGQGFEEMAVERFAKQIKMFVSKPMIQKYRMKESVCRTLLEEGDFEVKVKASVMKSDKCRMNLKYLEMQTLEAYYDEHMEMLKDVKGALKPSTKNSHMVKDFMECLKVPLEETEKAVVEKEKVLNVMQKMKFEISGYYKQSIVEDITQEKNPVQVSESLIKDIRSLNEGHWDGPVYGCGVIYGILQILVMDLNRDIREKIASKLKKHHFWYPYKITLLEKKPIELAGDMIETGERLLAVWSKDVIRQGTLGGFAVNGNGDKYGVTCAHVVSIPNNPAGSVYIDRNPRKQYIGKGDANTMVLNGAFDFAAIKVEGNDANCSVRLKDDDGTLRHTVLSQISPLAANQSYPYVYKYGAKSGLTKGTVAADRFNVFVNTELCYDCYLLIDQQPDFDPNQPIFAESGDSGSIVCTLDIEDPYRIVAMSMVRAGSMTLEELDLEKFALSFMLLRGIQALSAQTNHAVDLRFQ